MSKSANDRQLKRQMAVARLNREGRPAGKPRLGFRHVGRRKNRRAVPDQAQREILAMIVRLRDDEKLSWDKISDRVEEYRAAMENRRPLSRGFRRGWTNRSCIRGYRAAKEIAAGGPAPTHRRCPDCGRSLLRERFPKRGALCVDCDTTAALRRADARRLAGLRESLVTLGRAVRAGDPTAKIEQYTAAIVRLAGSPDLVGLDVERIISQAPGSRKALEVLSAIAALGSLAQQPGATGPDVRALGDHELDNEVRRLLAPLADEAATDVLFDMRKVLNGRD